MCCCLLFSCKVVSEPLWSRELQHVRLLCPPLSPGVCSNPESVVLSNHLKLCCPLLLLPSVFPGIRVFSNELDLRVSRSQYQGFNLTISPSNEYSGLISFRIDRFDLVVQRTLKSLLQNNHLKASILSKGQTCKQKSNAHFRILWSVKEKKMSYGEGNIRSIEC